MNAQGNKFTLGHNKFSTWTQAEYKSMLTGARPLEKVDSVHSDIIEAYDDIPESVDWRTSGFLPPVKDQGRMMDGTVILGWEIVQTMHEILTGQLENLSFQEVVDCCNTGGPMWVQTVLECIQKYPLELESDYPATGK